MQQARAELSASTKTRSSTIVDGVIPPQISGTPTTLRAQLEPVIQDSGAIEIMVQDMLTDHTARTRSREIIADVLGSIAI
ncbi:hypothetical protein [Verrucosispora sp. TAA-831]|uniref:hypothetical protein n=1 Tax=Verrucosispora sp. TAA-831 TaxID=3422227 RepID=UPI003D6ED5C3